MVQASRRKFHYIYKVTRVDNGKYYIGMHSTDDLEDGYFGSGKIITASIKKHGKEKHIKEILEFCDSRESLKEREKDRVSNELLSDPLCMNIRLGGHGGWDHVNNGSDLYRMRRSKGTVSSNRSPNRDRVIQAQKAVETRRANGKLGKWTYHEGFLGKKHSDNTKNLMSRSQIGAKNSQFGTCWVRKDADSLKIKRHELDSYLQQGYVKGRFMTPRSNLNLG